MNASIRLSFALALVASLATLAGCAGAQHDAWSAPRSYRETLVVGEPPLRSAAESPAVLSLSHERAKPVHVREAFTTGHDRAR